MYTKCKSEQTKFDFEIFKMIKIKIFKLKL